MAGMAQVVIDILTTPMGALAALAAIAVIALFAWWVLKEEPQKK